MFKRILCATDFSKASYEAVNTANRLAKVCNAELILLHVAVPVAPLPEVTEMTRFDFEAYEKAWRESAERKLKELVTTAVDKDVAVRPIVLGGLAAQTIDQCAENEKVDLIVIATHGMTGWRHYLMGSVAQKVIQNTCFPVLVVRGPKGK